MVKKGWKQGFLSSSLPIEFETAKNLVKEGFWLEPDYCYERDDSGQTKDFSVDLKADLYFPTSDPDKITAELVILAECKYRAPNTSWVFLPDVSKPDLSLGTLGYTVRTIDKFSFCKIPQEPIYDFEYNMPWCYKGTEINVMTKSTYDAEIRHGIAQLQYALPHLFKEQILFQISGHSDDNAPFFVLPVLVTTTELLVLKRDTTLDKVEATDNLEDITKKTPYLVLVSSFGPDFVRHAKMQFEELRDLSNYQCVTEIEERLQASGVEYYEFNLPSRLGVSLANGEHYQLNQWCSQFIVCSFDALSQMLDNLKQTIRECLRKRKSI